MPNVTSLNPATPPLFSFRSRRTIAISFTAIVSAIWLAGDLWVRSTLGRSSIYSGTTLLVCILLLTAMGARKRFPVLCLLKVSTWLQIHIYLGLFACLAYVVHVPQLIARGPLEWILSIVFLLTAVSGIYGLYQSRTVPRRLTHLNIQPRYDRIAWHRAHLAQAAEQIIHGLPASPAGDLLRDFYRRRLGPYFAQSISLLYRIHPNGLRRRRLLSAIGDLERYLDEHTAPAAQRLAGLARQYDDLNFHHALQFRLRAWLVFHITISLGLVALALVHTGVALGMLGD